MRARLTPNTYNVAAHCPRCRSITSFENRHSVIFNEHTEQAQGAYSRVFYGLNLCAGCQLGGLATIADRGSTWQAVLVDFYPISISAVHVPEAVPGDVLAEFREAERCAAFGFNRAASALFRSALEKTLKANGYTKANDPGLRDLQKRIDAAAADGVITSARQRKAHEDVRSLGNDVLHEEWREVTDEEVESAHHYTQRVIEDFYDDRKSVEILLREKKRVVDLQGGS